MQEYGEILARTFDNCNFRNGTMLINNTLTKDKDGKIILGKHTKTYDRKNNVDSGIREFPINKVIKEIIIEQKQTGISNIYNLLFWDYSSNRFINFINVNTWLEEINKKYKISKERLTSHILRYSRITEMRRNEMDMAVIQYLVGHVEKSTITDIYTTVDEEFTKQELKKVN